MFTLMGYSRRKSFLLACMSVVPDLDVFFGIHRSLSHSIIIWGILTIPFLLYYWEHDPDNTLFMFLAFISASIHIVSDSFSSYTPALWPLVSSSLFFHFDLLMEMNKGIHIIPILGVSSIPTSFNTFTEFDAQILTSEGFVITLVLLTPIIYQEIHERLSFHQDILHRLPFLSSIQAFFHNSDEPHKTQIQE